MVVDQVCRTIENYPFWLMYYDTQWSGAQMRMCVRSIFPPPPHAQLGKLMVAKLAMMGSTSPRQMTLLSRTMLMALTTLVQVSGSNPLGRRNVAVLVCMCSLARFAQTHM